MCKSGTSPHLWPRRVHSCHQQQQQITKVDMICFLFLSRIPNVCSVDIDLHEYGTLLAQFAGIILARWHNNVHCTVCRWISGTLHSEHWLMGEYSCKLVLLAHCQGHSVHVALAQGVEWGRDFGTKTRWWPLKRNKEKCKWKEKVWRGDDGC